MIDDDATEPTSGKRNPRDGWAEASRVIFGNGDAALIWPEFPNEDDAEFIW